MFLLVMLEVVLFLGQPTSPPRKVILSEAGIMSVHFFSS